MALHERAGAANYAWGGPGDLSPYYSRSHVLDLSNFVTMAVFREIIAMLGCRAQR